MPKINLIYDFEGKAEPKIQVRAAFLSYLITILISAFFSSQIIISNQRHKSFAVNNVKCNHKLGQMRPKSRTSNKSQQADAQSI